MKSNKIRIGVVGCGAMGRNHINMLKELRGVQISALIDPCEEIARERLEKICEPAGQCPAIFQDMEKAIDSVKMDGIIIVSPHAFHVPQITLALEKGLHVMCEKPLAATEEEVLKLMEKSKETGKIVQAAYAGVISDEQAYVKRLKESGELGEVTFVQGRVAQMWWPHAESGWRGKPEISGGGQVFDSGSHLLVSLLWLTDFDVEEVFAYVDYMHMKVEVNATIALKFSQGAMGSVTISGNASGFDHNATLFGTEGRASVGLYGMYMEHYRKNELIKSTKADFPANVCERFANVIKGKEKPLPLDYSLKLVRLQNAILESGKTGEPVRLQSG